MLKRLYSVSVIAVFCFGLSACKHEEPNAIYMPDMVYSPAYKAQKEGAMRMPVKGTVSRDFEAYGYATNPEGAGKELKNPLKATQSTLKRGQHMYNTYCIVCHGPGGEGDGTVVPKFPRPPSLISDKIRGWPDGRLYHVMTMGQNLMPSYASQIAAGDRWAIAQYVRVLQRAKHPTPEDIKISDEESK